MKPINLKHLLELLIEKFEKQLVVKRIYTHNSHPRQLTTQSIPTQINSHPNKFLSEGTDTHQTEENEKKSNLVAYICAVGSVVFCGNSLYLYHYYKHI